MFKTFLSIKILKTARLKFQIKQSYAKKNATLNVQCENYANKSFFFFFKLLKYFVLMVDQPYNIIFFVFNNLFKFMHDFYCIFIIFVQLLTFSCISVFSFFFLFAIDSSSSFIISGLVFLIYWIISLTFKFCI